MDCEEYRELISARQDGELSTEEEKKLINHLRHCPGCHEYAGDIEKLNEAMAAWPVEAFPLEIEHNILERINAGRRGPALPKFFRGYYRIPRGVAWAGVFIIFILVIGHFIDQPRFPSHPGDTAGETRKIVLTAHDIVNSYTVHGNVKK
jgi:anti-sigma factor RsiW